MEFSEQYRHTGEACCGWSPDGKWLATAQKHQLVVREADTLRLHTVLPCNHAIERVRWCPASRNVLCGMFSASALQVFSICSDTTAPPQSNKPPLPAAAASSSAGGRAASSSAARERASSSSRRAGMRPQMSRQEDNVEEELDLAPSPSCVCNIEDPGAGLVAAFWAPDGQHVITVADFTLYLKVYSLVTGELCLKVNNPKFGDRAVHFSHGGKYMAVAERADCKDWIAIYDTTKAWRASKRFQVETEDLFDFMWAADDRSICVWNSPLSYKVMVYPLHKGAKSKSYEAYKGALGLKTVRWSRDTHYLALGSYDQRIRLMNFYTWTVQQELSPVLPPSSNSPTLIYMEQICKATPDVPAHSIYTTVDRSAALQNIQRIKSDPKLPDPQLGIGMLEWSYDSAYFFARNDNMPNCLWIWDASSISLTAILVHVNPVRKATWHPTSPQLVVCTASSSLYIWTPGGAASCEVPLKGFLIRNVEWNANGDALLLLDKNRTCCCYPGPLQ
ncbi:WD repeat-containing protein WRAP73 [Balamuthia mandrillaris]